MAKRKVVVNVKTGARSERVARPVTRAKLQSQSPAEPDYDNMSDGDLMARCHAARAYVAAHENGLRASELAMYGFLSLFHPELTHGQKLELCRKD